MDFRLEIAKGREELALLAAARFLDVAADALRSRGVFRVALAGGETPRAAYARIAESWREAPGGPLDWGRVHLFWGDERMVPPGDARSNFGMARETLISRVPIPAGNVHPVPTTGYDAGADAAAAASDTAARYERTLRETFPEAREGAPPRFDLVILGMGADGHTASLFPGDPALLEEKRWVVAARHPGSGEPRVTLTLPVLNHTAATIVLATGREKAAVMERAVRGRGHGRDPARDAAVRPPLPIELLRPAPGTLLFLADEEAAAWARSEDSGPNR